MQAALVTAMALSGKSAGYPNAGPCSRWCAARTGWDGPTGLGTPNGVGAI